MDQNGVVSGLAVGVDRVSICRATCPSARKRAAKCVRGGSAPVEGCISFITPLMVLESYMHGQLALRII